MYNVQCAMAPGGSSQARPHNYYTLNRGGDYLNICYQKEDKLLMVELLGEIDHHTTEKIRRRIDYEIQRYLPGKVIFDFSKVPFMDSAGIGMLVGRYKLVTMLGCSLELIHVKSSIKKILAMSGVLKIISVTEEDEEEDHERIV